MRWFRLGAIGIGFSAVLVAIQGCTLKDAGLFFLVLFALMLPGLGGADSDSIEVIDRGKTDVKGEVQISTVAESKSEEAVDLVIRVTDPSANALAAIDVILTSSQYGLFLMVLDLTGNHLPAFWTGSRSELLVSQNEGIVSLASNTLSPESDGQFSKTKDGTIVFVLYPTSDQVYKVISDPAIVAQLSNQVTQKCVTSSTPQRPRFTQKVGLHNEINGLWDRLRSINTNLVFDTTYLAIQYGGKIFLASLMSNVSQVSAGFTSFLIASGLQEHQVRYIEYDAYQCEAGLSILTLLIIIAPVNRLSIVGHGRPEGDVQWLLPADGATLSLNKVTFFQVPVGFTLASGGEASLHICLADSQASGGLCMHEDSIVFGAGRTWASGYTFHFALKVVDNVAGCHPDSICVLRTSIPSGRLRITVELRDDMGKAVSFNDIDGVTKTHLEITYSVTFTIKGNCTAPTGSTGSKTLQFSGFTWEVRQTTEQSGPGSNLWSDSSSSVWCDSQGRLHLKLWKSPSGEWYSAEVNTKENLGYGEYTFELASDEFLRNDLHPNVVLGFFTSRSWNDILACREDAYSELDIEFSKFGDPLIATPTIYSVQPAGDFAERSHRPSGVYGTTQSTHIIDWKNNRVAFSSFDGIGNLGSSAMGSFMFENSNPARQGTNSAIYPCAPTNPIVIPKPDLDTKAHINLWIQRTFDLILPGFTGAEAIINGFSFEPWAR